jgi:ABC-type amino acid transport system permease subunit
MRSIILPQALRITVPPMANYAVPLLKGCLEGIADRRRNSCCVQAT